LLHASARSEERRRTGRSETDRMRGLRNRED
jgi:hypothetical protein